MLLRGSEPKYRRESGILLHISSLPSDFGIGSLGREAYRFVDFLRESGQTYWQILPLTPVGKGNSPYSSVSSFAGEILYIDIEMLINDGLLDAGDVKTGQFPGNTDYRMVRAAKLPLLRKAAENFSARNRDFLKFQRKNEYWLSHYALFAAIKEVYHTEFYNLDDGLKYRLPPAIEEFRRSHGKEILFHKITQYFFYCQYFRLKDYATKNGIKIIGDIPFYLSLDSADVWSNPDIFRLGRDLTPILVAGVPPDVFSENGQLWGNPVYDWDFQKKTNYFWWRQRLRHNRELYDILRIDHFRAFADYYTIPFGAQNAKSGTWERGVGAAFWKIIKQNIGTAEIIAEDLGGDTPEVRKLLADTGFPNMKILQFAFDSDLKNPFIPKNYPKNCVCYTGTHDNDTTLGWYGKATEKEKLLFKRLVNPGKGVSPVYALISYGMKSRARIVIIPMQDYLCLDSNHRMNTPGTASGNWVWRLSHSDLGDELAATVKKLSKGRN